MQPKEFVEYLDEITKALGYKLGYMSQAEDTKKMINTVVELHAKHKISKAIKKLGHDINTKDLPPDLGCY